jgi:DNA replication protein DnaC
MYTSFAETTHRAEEHKWSYQQFLAALCDQELTGREQRRIERYLQQSKLPIGKTLETFDFTCLTSVTAAHITAFAETVTWVKQAHNLILFGPSGVGKTHLAAAIGRRLTQKGIRVLFQKTTSLVQQLQLAYNEHKLQDMLNKLGAYDLLILDDLGYVRKTESETSVLFDLIADRYESKSIMITANQPFDKWEEIFPNVTITVAAIDRLVHHAAIISLDEQSYRKASREKAIISEKNT